jgi:anti-sigma factor RsiW
LREAMSNPQTYNVKNDELNCESVRDDLHSFLMNELSDGDVRRVVAHLAACEDCRQALREHVELFGLLREHSDLLGRLLDEGPPRKG